MAYNAIIGNNFWYEFDDTFKDNPTPASAAALSAVFPGFQFDIYLNKWVQRYRAGQSQNYLNDVQAHKNAFQDLAVLQDATFQKYFFGDLADEQAAFEDFGQGVLYDARRPVGNGVHMMDVNDNNQQIGYQRWYTFAYALQLMNIDQQIWAPRLTFIVLALASI